MKKEDLDLENTCEGYAGTFRWSKSKPLPSVPTDAQGEVCVDKSWLTYLKRRYVYSARSYAEYHTLPLHTTALFAGAHPHPQRS
jgi:hypothetical protein